MKKIGATICAGIILGIGSFLMWGNPAYKSAALAPSPQPSLIEQAQAFIFPVSQQVNYVPIRDYSIADPTLAARAGIVYDVQSNRVLFQKAAEQRMPIASITKLMSAMVIVDHLDLNATYEITAEDMNVDGDGADLKKGETFTGHELLTYALIRSSNDAITALASSVTQQGFDFAALMNERALQLGMHDTHFEDAAGLSDQGGYSTAFDVVKLVRATAAYPEIQKILRHPQADVTSLAGTVRHIINTNQLLTTIPHVIVGKTGNTTGALGTLVLEVGINDQGDAIVVVALGSQDRFGETKMLIDWAKQAHSWSRTP